MADVLWLSKPMLLGGRPRCSILRVTICAVIASLVGAVTAHEHKNLPDNKAISDDPIDSILFAHIAIQVLAFGIIFPIGMVLGIIRSRWHVPLQTVGTLLVITGYFLGHSHKGRRFAPNIHSASSGGVMMMLATQVALGTYLRFHLTKGIHGRIRRYTVMVHGVLGKTLPVVGWVQMIFGRITAMGYCRADHFGQCVAHFIMGSAFIGYGILLTIVLVVGQHWLRRTGRSQEFFDSAVITVWGIVNTFTEHSWGDPWGGTDMQHTTMGIVWWCAGMAGLWSSRTRDGRPSRNIIPGVVIVLTGWAMSSHGQRIPLSTMVHRVFGYSLMAAGFARIIEISFVLKDGGGLQEDEFDGYPKINSFQYLPPLLLFASGFIFMGATEEQMQLISDAGIGHVSYILLLYSLAFLLFFFVLVLLHIYYRGTTTINTNYPSNSGTVPLAFHDRATSSHRGNISSPESSATLPSGELSRRIHPTSSTGMNGHVLPASASVMAVAAAAARNGPTNRKMLRNGDESLTNTTRLRDDVEEFELQGLISGADDDDDDDDHSAGGKLLVGKR